MHLHLMEEVKADTFIARYSGEKINKTECDKRSGHYRVKVHDDLYLDAENCKHFEGRLT